MSSNQSPIHAEHLQVLHNHEVMHLSCVTFRYNGESRSVLQACSGVVCKGDVTILTGHNGSGKSTLCRLLAGVLSAHEGTMEGKLLVASHPEPLIGYIGGEAAQQFVIGVVEDELAFGPENLGVSADEIHLRIERELAAVDMTAYRTARVEQLSGGQQQRIAAAAVWTMNPDILVVDDAWSSLDAEGRKRFTEALYRWFTASPDRTLLVATSRPAELSLEHPLWSKAVYWTLEGGHLHTSNQQPVMGIAADGNYIDKAIMVENKPINAVHRLELEQVSVAYRNGVAPLREVSAVCQAGDGILLCGSNGAGKSTLLKLLCGYLRPQKGRVIIDGQDLHRMRSHEWARLAGYVPQRAAASFITERVIDECREVYQELSLEASSADSWCSEQLQRIELAEFAELHPHDLSASAQRRLSMWIATIHQPRILLLDEPTAGLDEHAAAEVIAWCQRERERGAIVMAASHDPLWLQDTHWQHWVVADGRIQGF